MRVMIVVTHLLGTGHLARALTLGRAFGMAGHDIIVVSGGAPVPHFDARALRLEHMPPLRSDGTDFTTLLDDQGGVATPELRTERIAALLHFFETDCPDVLITELFPFGRRNLRDEFGALLEAATAAGTLILASVRDILAPPSKPAKAAFADDMIQRHYHGVLVHADREIITLDRSWPVSEALAQRLHYTGFVAPPPPTPGQSGNTILVSAGGGTVGDAIFDASLAAAALQKDAPWHLLIGGDAMRRDAYAARATANVQIDPPRHDFRALMGQAAASVSMCGYNTTLDLLQTGVPAVIVPFDDGDEVEQGLRGDALSSLPGIQVLRQADLTADRLLHAVDVAQQASRSPRHTGMDGAKETVRITQHLWEAHRDQA
ncbi:MAG: glycosyltransferase [Pseudomonadota bacterium]